MNLPDSTASDLGEDGAVMFKVTSHPESRLDRILGQLEKLDELDSAFAEKMGSYMRHGGRDLSELEGKPYLGSFGALNWPSSYRVGNFIRDKAVQRVNAFLCVPEGQVVSQLPDRIVFRPKGARISRESPHRDLPDLKIFAKLNRKYHQGEEPRELGKIYQGWVNLGPGDTTLTYVPGSHNDIVNTDRNGFSQENPTIDQTPQDFTTVSIPPGEAVLFDPRLVHKVASGTVKQAFTRVHFGIRVAKDDQPLYLDQNVLLDSGLPPRLPSGQLVPIVTSNFRSLHKSTKDKWLEVNKPILKPGYKWAKGGFVGKCNV